MTRTRTIALAVLAVAAVVVGGFIAYDQVLRGDSVAALALPDASPSSAATTDPEPTLAPASNEPSNDPSTDGGVAGEWSVGAGSVAGYRVREQLANLPAESDAVGRTEDVSGSITVESAGDAARLTAGTLTVDTTTIQSDEARRDNRLRNEGLQTDQFRTATFTITQPVDVPVAALSGTPTDLRLVGDLTLHGVTKSVEIPGAGPADRRADPGRRLADVPADGLRHLAPQRRRVHPVDRRRRGARVPRLVREGVTPTRYLV